MKYKQFQAAFAHKNKGRKEEYVNSLIGRYEKAKNWTNVHNLFGMLDDNGNGTIDNGEFMSIPTKLGM